MNTIRKWEAKLLRWYTTNLLNMDVYSEKDILTPEEFEKILEIDFDTEVFLNELYPRERFVVDVVMVIAAPIFKICVTYVRHRYKHNKHREA